jgi:hypothetical protein
LRTGRAVSGAIREKRDFLHRQPRSRRQPPRPEMRPCSAARRLPSMNYFTTPDRGTRAPRKPELAHGPISAGHKRVRWP